MKTFHLFSVSYTMRYAWQLKCRYPHIAFGQLLSLAHINAKRSSGAIYAH